MDVVVQETQPRRRLEFEHDETLSNSGIDCDMMESLHSKISKASIPTIGMEFESEDDAYEFYNAYALAVGFSVRRGNRHTKKETVLDRTFVCSCEGKRGKDKRDDVYKSHRPETRFGCLALLKVSCRQTGKYHVVKFNAKHNHNLASPSKAHLFRSHRKLSMSQASQVEIADISGIAPKNAFESMAREAGGRENLGFSHVDYKNYLRTKRNMKMRPGDTGGVLEYLQRMKVDDPSFFYAIQVDEEDMITNIFWVDAKIKADYEDFGDVVSFDTTYRKHKDGRPIALFVGANHHKQTTIFGAALLYDETTNSFVWLFDTFLRAMGGNPPKTILTDQDAAMSSALASQWPQTYHRLCIWHIYPNAAVHLSSVFARNHDFSRDFSTCIYDYEHEEDFLHAWDRMLEKYELQNNDWMKRMFNIRKKKWALVYGRDTFCADMTTTQRSESMNRVIKQYISYKHDLRRFFENFQRLLDDRRYNETVADFKASQSKVVLPFPIQILKHAAEIYTPEVFKLFQEESCKSYDCHLEICGETDAVVKYTITPDMKQYKYIVSYEEKGETICCSCRKFEFAGLLCSHILKVLSVRGIKEVPGKYILKRWTKNAKKGIARDVGECFTGQSDPKTAAGRRYRDLCRLSTRLVTRAAEFEEGYNLVKEGLLSLFNALDLNSTKRVVLSSLESYHMEPNDPSPDIPINANEVTKTIRGIKSKPKSGSQSSKRIMGALETSRRKTRQPKRTKSTNKELQCTIPSYPVLGNQIAGSVPQRSVYFNHPLEPSHYNPSMLLDPRQLNMYVGSPCTQTSQQFQPSHTSFSPQTQASTQFSHDNGQWRISG